MVAQLYKYYLQDDDDADVEITEVISDSFTLGMDSVDVGTIQLLVGDDSRHEWLTQKGRGFKKVRVSDSYVEFRGWITEVRLNGGDKYNVTLKLRAKTHIFSQLKSSLSGDVLGFKGKISAVDDADPFLIFDNSRDFSNADWTSIVAGYVDSDFAIFLVPGESSTYVASPADGEGANTTGGASETGTFNNVIDNSLKTFYGVALQPASTLDGSLEGSSVTAKASVVAAKVKMSAKVLMPNNEGITLTAQMQYLDVVDGNTWKNIGNSFVKKGSLWNLLPTFSGQLTFEGFIPNSGFLDGSDDWSIRLHITTAGGSMHCNMHIHTLQVNIFSDMKYDGSVLTVKECDYTSINYDINEDIGAAGVDVGDTYQLVRKSGDVLAAIFDSFTSEDLRHVAYDIDANFDTYTGKNFTDMNLIDVLSYICERERAHWWYDQDYEVGGAEGRIRVYKESTLVSSPGSLKEPSESDIEDYSYDDKTDSHVKSVEIIGATYKRGDGTEITAGYTFPGKNDDAINTTSMVNHIEEVPEIYTETEAKAVAEAKYNHFNEDTISVSIFPIASQSWEISDRVSISLDNIDHANELITGYTHMYSPKDNHLIQSYHLGFQATPLEKRLTLKIHKMERQLKQILMQGRDLHPSKFLRADGENAGTIDDEFTFISPVNFEDSAEFKDEMAIWKNEFRQKLVSNATADRQITLPDADTEMVGTDTTQTLVAKTFTAPAITNPDGGVDQTLTASGEEGLEEIVCSRNFRCDTGIFAATTVTVGDQIISEAGGLLVVTATTPGVVIKDSDDPVATADGYFRLVANDDTTMFQLGCVNGAVSLNNYTANKDIGFNTTGTGKISINGSAAKVDTILDEDAMGSDDPNGLATQQSIKAYIDAANMIGAANKAWVPAALMGGDPNTAWLAGAPNIANVGSTDYWLVFNCPLPLTLGSLNLYIDGVQYGLYDADGSNFVTRIIVRQSGDVSTWNAIYDNSDNVTTIDDHSLTGWAASMSGYHDIKIGFQCTVATALYLDFSYVKWSCYYA